MQSLEPITVISVIRLNHYLLAFVPFFDHDYQSKIGFNCLFRNAVKSKG